MTRAAAASGRGLLLRAPSAQPLAQPACPDDTCSPSALNAPERMKTAASAPASLAFLPSPLENQLIFVPKITPERTPAGMLPGEAGYWLELSRIDLAAAQLEAVIVHLSDTARHTSITKLSLWYSLWPCTIPMTPLSYASCVAGTQR